MLFLWCVYVAAFARWVRVGAANLLFSVYVRLWVNLKYSYNVILLHSDYMPTVRINEENYGYVIGVAARLQTETKQLKTPNDAIGELIKVYKVYAEMCRLKSVEAEQTKKEA